MKKETKRKRKKKSVKKCSKCPKNPEAKKNDLLKDKEYMKKYKMVRSFINVDVNDKERVERWYLFLTCDPTPSMIEKIFPGGKMFID